MNANIFFLDTGYLIALEASNDKNHTRAKNHWQNLIRSRPSLVTTSFVFDEVVTFLIVEIDTIKQLKLARAS